MKLTNTVALFAAAAFAQNEIQDPEIDPNQSILPVDQLFVDVQPFAQELFNVNSSVIALDKAIIAVGGPADIPPALQASADLINVINAEAADALTHPKINVSDDDPDYATKLGPILDYAGSLIYHINHTVVNLVIAEPLAVQFCQGPTILQAIQDQTTAARALIDNFIAKLPDSLVDLAPTYVQPIFDALSSASAAYADQTTTSDGCTPPPSTTAITTGTDLPTSTGETTATSTSTVGPSGSGPSNGWNTWAPSTALPSHSGYVTSSAPCTTGSKPTISASIPRSIWNNWSNTISTVSKPTISPSVSASAWNNWSASGSQTKTATGTQGWVAVSAVPTYPGKTYTGAAIANNICIGTVVIAGLAAVLL